MGMKPVEEFNWGLYVWLFKDKDGNSWWASDADGNIMNIASRKGDRVKIQKLIDAARYWGFPDGEAVFLSGRRAITDEEFEYQKQRMEWGLTPDPLDAGAYKDEIKRIKNGR